jgi:glycosyltransferase involved in cell wall biosynthesis
MHIVHVGADLERQTTNGVNRVVALLARQQRELGCDVSLVRFDGRRASRTVDEETGIGICRLPVPRLPARLSQEAREVFQRNCLRADIFHFHSAFVLAHNLAAQRLPAPYVVSPHGNYHSSALMRSRWRKLAYRVLLDQRFLCNAALLHVLTEDEASSVAAYAPARRLVVVPNPIEAVTPPLPDEREEARRVLGIGEELCLVYVGRLDVQQKGLDLLIEGVRRARKHSRLRLLIAGPVAGRSDVRDLLREDDRDSISVLPPVFDGDRRRLLAAADYFVSTSRWEGQPTAVLEALAGGLPVLVTEATGLAGFVRCHRAGLVTEPTPEAIAASLRILAETAPGHLGETATSLAVQEQFGVRAITEKLMSHYVDCIES